MSSAVKSPRGLAQSGNLKWARELDSNLQGYIQ